MSEIQFGTDPEVFAVEPGTTNLVPPEYAIKALGMNPIRIDYTEAGVRHPIFADNGDFVIHGDGALFEFTIKPETSMVELYKNFVRAKDSLSELLDKHGLEVLHSPIANFDVKRYFEEMDDESIRTSVIAGCDPDLDAIDSYYESKVRDLTGWEFRGAGGHIHVQPNYDKLHDNILPAIRLMAIFAGNAYIYNSKDLKSEKLRQRVFGKPGRYRFQTYSNGKQGMEYRTPSNSWLHDEESALFMESAVRSAIEHLKNPKKGVEVIEDYLDRTIQAITTVNRSVAKEVLDGVMG